MLTLKPRIINLPSVAVGQRHAFELQLRNNSPSEVTLRITPGSPERWTVRPAIVEFNRPNEWQTVTLSLLLPANHRLRGGQTVTDTFRMHSDFFKQNFRATFTLESGPSSVVGGGGGGGGTQRVRRITAREERRRERLATEGEDLGLAMSYIDEANEMYSGGARGRSAGIGGRRRRTSAPPRRPAARGGGSSGTAVRSRSSSPPPSPPFATRAQTGSRFRELRAAAFSDGRGSTANGVENGGRSSVMTSSTFRGASSSEVAFHEPPAMAGEAAAKRRVLSHLADLEAQIKLANQENESLRAQRKAERRAADQRAESVMAVLGAKDAELVSMGKELERVAKMETSGRHAVAEKRAQIRDLRSQIVEAEAEQRVSFIYLFHSIV